MEILLVPYGHSCDWDWQDPSCQYSLIPTGKGHGEKVAGCSCQFGKGESIRLKDSKKGWTYPLGYIPGVGIFGQHSYFGSSHY